MRFQFVVLFALVAAVFAAPVPNADSEATLVEREAEADPQCKSLNDSGCM